MSSSEREFLESLGAVPVLPVNAFSAVMRTIKRNILFVRLAWSLGFASVVVAVGMISFLPGQRSVPMSAEVVEEMRDMYEYFSGFDVQEEGRLYLAMDESLLR